ncbi:MAG: M15 family metallopeptidase [Burkholderiales bacterium]|nr:M15 family metallopeptidase [Burkholderiales bacterium]
MVFGVVLYFLLVTAVLAWLFLPPVRSLAGSGLQRARAWGQGRSRRWVASGTRRGAATGRWLHGLQARARAGWRSHWRMLCPALLLLLAVPALALALRGWWRLDGFDHTATRVVDERVAALLQGEQLVPPPPLPPELFSTRELELSRPLVGTASRQWELLDEDFRRRLLLVFKLLRQQHGYEAVLLEGYRSPERQQALAALGPTVTQAGAFESYHQHGLAADVAFLREGRIVISERDEWAMRGYEHYGALAASVGLTWGGQWRGLKDYGHVELRRPGVLPSPQAPAAR